MGTTIFLVLPIKVSFAQNLEEPPHYEAEEGAMVLKISKRHGTSARLGLPTFTEKGGGLKSLGQ